MFLFVYGYYRTFVVGLHVSQMVSSGIVSFAHAHGVVGKVDIAVVALQTVRKNLER
jgi:hypothetical protein